MYCEKCGGQLPDGSIRCYKCGAVFVQVDNGNSLIPDNSRALWAYYLGIGSLLAGPLLGIPAIVLGIMGLNYAKENPQARGGNHAIAGIVCASLNLLFLLFVVICAAAN